MAVSEMMIVKAATGSLPFPRRKTCSRHEKLASAFLMILIMVLVVWTKGTSGEIQANITTVETLSETQIKVTWQPYEEAHYKPYHYELYIDEHLEYFGNDVMYVARRLIPNTIYYFKLRLCVENTNQCTPYSTTLSGTTDQSQKRSFTKSFLQWMFVCLVVMALACTTAVVGVMNISRKLWRSFLYKYDYTSQTVVGLPKYLETTDGLDADEKSPLSLCRVDTSEKLNPQRREITSIFYANSQKETHADHDIEIHENTSPLALEEDQSFNTTDSEQDGVSEHQHCDTVDGSEIYELHSNASCVREREPTEIFMQVNHLKNDAIPNAESNFEKYDDDSCDFLEIANVEKTDSPGNSEDRVLETESPKMTNSRHTAEQNTWKSSEGQLKTYQAEDFAKHHHFKNNRHEHTQRHPPLAREEIKDISLRHPELTREEIVVAVDNSNVFIGAQECACLLNPRERKRNIRVKIQQLVKVFERGRTLSRAFVQGSSPPSTEQVWEVYRRLGYCVDLEDRRGKDEQRVDEGLHLHIYKALCELSPRKLVIASGDGNKGKSEGATSLPGCAQAALDKGWMIEVHSWQHSLSTEWLKLARKYPVLVTIHYLDRYIDHITFVDGKYGRRCQPFPTDFLKRMS